MTEQDGADKSWDTDHWDVGWELNADRALGAVESPYFGTQIMPDQVTEATIQIPEVGRPRGVPMDINIRDDALRVGTLVDLSPEEARELAAALREAAAVAEVESDD